MSKSHRSSPHKIAKGPPESVSEKTASDLISNHIPIKSPPILLLQQGPRVFFCSSWYLLRVCKLEGCPLIQGVRSSHFNAVSVTTRCATKSMETATCLISRLDDPLKQEMVRGFCIPTFCPPSKLHFNTWKMGYSLHLPIYQGQGSSSLRKKDAFSLSSVTPEGPGCRLQWQVSTFSSNKITSKWCSSLVKSHPRNWQNRMESHGKCEVFICTTLVEPKPNHQCSGLSSFFH